MAKRSNEDFWVSVVTGPFLLYILYLIIKSLSATSKDFAIMGFAIFGIAVTGYIFYVFKGVKRRYG